MITKPTVTLIGQTELATTNFNQQVEKHGGTQKMLDRSTFTGQWADKIVEYAGRLCYMSFDKPRPGGSEAYHQHIKEVGHYSVHEHAVFTFSIEGISRSLTHELIRHRHLSPSQLSQRFVDESSVEIVMPPLFQLFEYQNAPFVVESFMRGVRETYENLVNLAEDEIKTLFPNLSFTERRKMVREAARCVLPNMTETKIVLTANARAWRHFLHLRGSRHADMEIRRLALVLCKELQRETTYLFNDIREIEIENRPGEHELHSDYWEKE